MVFSLHLSSLISLQIFFVQVNSFVTAPEPLHLLHSIQNPKNEHLIGPSLIRQLLFIIKLKSEKTRLPGPDIYEKYRQCSERQLNRKLSGFHHSIYSLFDIFLDVVFLRNQQLDKSIRYCGNYLSGLVLRNDYTSMQRE